MLHSRAGVIQTIRPRQIRLVWGWVLGFWAWDKFWGRIVTDSGRAEDANCRSRNHSCRQEVGQVISGTGDISFSINSTLAHVI